MLVASNLLHQKLICSKLLYVTEVINTLVFILCGYLTMGYALNVCQGEKLHKLGVVNSTVILLYFIILTLIVIGEKVLTLRLWLKRRFSKRHRSMKYLAKDAPEANRVPDSFKP